MLRHADLTLLFRDLAFLLWVRAGPLRKVIPRSSRNARIWLMTAVRRETSRSRTRCSACRSSWWSVLMGTKRMFSRSTAAPAPGITAHVPHAGTPMPNPTRACGPGVSGCGLAGGGAGVRGGARGR